MIPNAAHQYQQVQITVTSPGEVLVQLLDGLVRFLNVARHCMRNGQRARAGESLSKAHAIVSELYLALDPSHAPDLCKNLAGIYNFSLDRISYATRKSDPDAIDEVVRVIAPIREGFTTAVRQLGGQAGRGRP